MERGAATVGGIPGKGAAGRAAPAGGGGAQGGGGVGSGGPQVGGVALECHRTPLSSRAPPLNKTDLENE